MNAAFASHLVPGSVPIRRTGELMMILSGSARGRKDPNNGASRYLRCSRLTRSGTVEWILGTLSQKRARKQEGNELPVSYGGDGMERTSGRPRFSYS